MSLRPKVRNATVSATERLAQKKDEVQAAGREIRRLTNRGKLLVGVAALERGAQSPAMQSFLRSVLAGAPDRNKEAIFLALKAANVPLENAEVQTSDNAQSTVSTVAAAPAKSVKGSSAEESRREGKIALPKPQEAGSKSASDKTSAIPVTIDTDSISLPVETKTQPIKGG